MTGEIFDKALDPSGGQTNHGKELSSLDFEKLISGPLCACVKAQTTAAIQTVSFVKQFGFQAGSDGELTDPVYVEFSYDKPGLFGMPTKSKLKVPFLTMLPIPSLRLESVEIEFLAKITSTVSVNVDTSTMSMTTSNTSSQSSSENESSGNNKSWWWNYNSQWKNSSSYTSSSSMMAMMTSQVNTKEGATVTKEFSISVKVKAVQDAMPAGLEKVLSILEGNTREDSTSQTEQMMMNMMQGQGAPGMGATGGAAGGDAAAAPADDGN